MSRRPCTFKQTDIRRAILAVQTAGEKVHRVEINKDGSIVLEISGKVAPKANNDLDQELAEFEAHHGQD